MKAKINALRAKTTAAGCTEAEAMAAAETAARLMRDHGLSEAELVMTDASAPEPSSRANWRWELADTVAAVTNTAFIWDAGAFIFIGRAPGPEIAAYLQDICVRAVDRELATFKASDFYRRRRKAATRRAATTDFVEAMALRLRERLRILFRGHRSSTARVAAEQALHERYPDTRTVQRSERSTRYDLAALAGHQAGSRTRLDPGISGGAAPQLQHRGGKA